MNSNSPHDDVYLGGVNVLVVDDYEPVRAAVSAILERYGAAVTAVGSADEALEALEPRTSRCLRERPGDARQGRLLAHRPGSRPAARARGRDACGRPHRIHRSRAPGQHLARRFLSFAENGDGPAAHPAP